MATWTQIDRWSDYKLLLTRAQVRAVDRHAIEQLGLPGVVLMENAANHTVRVIADYLANVMGVDPAAARIAVICGGGNNGGDGYAIARHLVVRHGCAVQVFAAVPPEKLSGDAAINHRVAAAMALRIAPLPPGKLSLNPSLHIVVDALLGTGFSGAVREPLAGVIESINAWRCAPGGPRNPECGMRNSEPISWDAPCVVAVDVPSGLDCDTGAASGPAVRADLTVTFVARKRGFEQPAAREYLGEVVVVDIGAPVCLDQM